MIACWFFARSCFVLTFYVILCPFLINQIVWFGFFLQLFGVLLFLFKTCQ